MAESNGEIIVRRIEEPSAEVVRQIMDVGHSAWSAALHNRKPAEIDHLYDSSDPVAVARNMGRISNIGKRGLYLAAYEAQTDEMVAYIAAANDISGSPMAKYLITHVIKREPYIWIPILNVHAKTQHMGVGTALYREIIQEGIFTESQKPTAYVLDENHMAKSFWASRAAMSLSPEYQVAKLLPGYFGPSTDIALQWRYEGPPIGLTVEFIDEMRRIGSQVAEVTRL